MKKELSHINKEGQATMVDVSEKMPSTRTAVATGRVYFPKAIFEQLGKERFLSKKGSILQTAILAGIQGAKQTAQLIPLCHPLQLSKVDVAIIPENGSLRIQCEVKCHGRTGVEMEALTGVNIAALTIYDMCKALSHEIRISDIQLEKKTGGKQDYGN